MTHGQNLCLKCWLWNKNKKKCEGEEGDWCKILNDYFGKRKSK